MLTNRTQSRVSISGLTYNNLIEDAYNAIKDSDEFKNSFSTFTSNEAARMIVELYAYVANQLANRMDQMGNELFVDTASNYGLSRLLKLVGAQVDFPAAASCEVEVSTSAVTDDITFSIGIDAGGTSADLDFIPGAFKSVTANNGTTWEFIKKEIGENGEYVYNYAYPFKFSAPSETYVVHEGTTHSYEYTIRSVNPDIITLPSNSIIKDSVRVYYKQKVQISGRDNAYEIVEFKKVDNFFTTTALTSNVGIYTIRNMGGGKCEICLKPYYNEDNAISDIGKELLIMYRTGGGEDGNIAIGSIYKTERFDTKSGTRTTGVGEFTINNTSSGNGGKNELTTNEIRSTVVNEVRNTKIAITEEDYEYLLPKYDSEISLLKSYGEKSEETADLAETYGYYANPIAVWLIILKNNTDFRSAYLSGEPGLTERINDISFNILDINPRFDEQYQVNTASINQYFSKITLDDECYTEESNQYILQLNQQGANILSKGNAKVTITNAPYVDSALESRRGVNCFNRYDNLTGVVDTWEDLIGTTGANVGDVYLVKGADPDNIPYDRWRCIKAYDSPAEYHYEDYWKKVDFDYVYDNLISSDSDNIDVMYVQQSDSNPSDFTSLYSYLSHSFSAAWNDFVKWYGTDGSVPVVLNGIRMVINGIVIDFGSREFSSLSDLVGFINDKVSPVTYRVVLKDNIAPLTNDPPTSEPLLHTAATGSSGIQIKLNNVTRNITVDTSTATTYGDLLTKINEALTAEGLNDDIKCVFNQSSDCYDLWLISKSAFSYKDSSTAEEDAIYKYILEHPDYNNEWLNAEKQEIEDTTLIESWAGYFSSDGDPIVQISGNNLELLFDDNGDSSIKIEGNGASSLREMFGLGPDDSSENVKKSRREINVTFSPGSGITSPSAYIIIDMSSDTDTLKEGLYVNIFGNVNDNIVLGSYYEKVEDYLPSDTSETVLNLLRRRPIKALYSTSYSTENGTASVDKYGCNYQLKFSTGLVEEQTYNELSSGNSPAYVETTKPSYDTMRLFGNDDYLYLKVDGIEYEGDGGFTLDNQVYEVPEEKGYARFNMSWFNSHIILDFINAIVKTFENYGDNGESLLDDIVIEEDKIRLFTRSTAFYSSLNFGNTNDTIISYLFGINDVTVYSKEGQIDVTQIPYSIFSLTNYPAIGKNLSITYNNEEAKNVSVGYSMSQFESSVESAFPDGEIVVNNNRLILADLSNGSKIRVDLAWDDQIGKSAWQKMFTDITWGDFHITEQAKYRYTTDTKVKADKTYYIKENEEYVDAHLTVGADIPQPNTTYYEQYYEEGSAYCEYENEGDYYIELTNDESGKNIYTLKVENESKFPLGNIYAHMYEDYSYDHIVYSDSNGVIYTDEYNWNNLMKERRVMLTEHVYKQPRFIPFDLAITCRLPNTEEFSQTKYDEELRSFLRSEYGIYSNNIGKEIVPDEIILNIKGSFANITSVSVDYLGYNMLSDITNKSKLETKFNQQHVIASDEISVESIINEQGLYSSQTVTKHGLKITLEYSA